LFPPLPQCYQEFEETTLSKEDAILAERRTAVSEIILVIEAYLFTDYIQAIRDGTIEDTTDDWKAVLKAYESDNHRIVNFERPSDGLSALMIAISNDAEEDLVKGMHPYIDWGRFEESPHLYQLTAGASQLSSLTIRMSRFEAIMSKGGSVETLRDILDVDTPEEFKITGSWVSRHAKGITINYDYATQTWNVSYSTSESYKFNSRYTNIRHVTNDDKAAIHLAVERALVKLRDPTQTLPEKYKREFRSLLEAFKFRHFVEGQDVEKEQKIDSEEGSELVLLAPSFPAASHIQKPRHCTLPGPECDQDILRYLNTRKEECDLATIINERNSKGENALTIALKKYPDNREGMFGILKAILYQDFVVDIYTKHVEYIALTIERTETLSESFKALIRLLKHKMIFNSAITGEKDRKEEKDQGRIKQLYDGESKPFVRIDEWTLGWVYKWVWTANYHYDTAELIPGEKYHSDNSPSIPTCRPNLKSIRQCEQRV
jgi:hypothetical protein